MKDSIADKYPQLKEINGRYNTKRWYLPKGTEAAKLSIFLWKRSTPCKCFKTFGNKKYARCTLR